MTDSYSSPRSTIEKYKYDKEGNILEKLRYNTEGTLIEEIKYSNNVLWNHKKYDKNKKLIWENKENYNPGDPWGDGNETISYSYNKIGLLIKKKIYSVGTYPPKKECDIVIKYKYNKSGLLIEDMINFFPRGDFHWNNDRKTEYSYSEDGLILKEVFLSNSENNDKMRINEIWEYKYKNDGKRNWIEKIHYSSQLFPKDNPVFTPKYITKRTIDYFTSDLKNSVTTYSLN